MRLAKHLHCGKSNDGSDYDFHAFLHVEILDDQDRENRKHPVRKRVESRNHEREVHD